MAEKDTVSMSTVEMKPDYATSEVYSTTNEAPPAYKRESNSVKIAKITAFTVITASFIIGVFILASSYLQAKASCNQVQALDSVLEKELMLETLQQVNKELPRAEALLGAEKREVLDNSINIESSAPKSQNAWNKNKLATNSQNDEDAINEDNNSSTETEDSDEQVRKYPGKVPLELDLSDLAAALLQSNKKSRMNCVVERKQAEEFFDSQSKTVLLPFGVHMTTDPKKSRVTGERISIYCESGSENNNNNIRDTESLENRQNNNREEEEDSNNVEVEIKPLRPMFIPYQRVSIPFGTVLRQFPLTHMPQRMMPPNQQPAQQPPAPMVQQLPPAFQQMQIRPPMPPPPPMNQVSRPESPVHIMMDGPKQQTVRIHVQELPLREIHVADDIPIQIPQSQHPGLPQFQMQRLPLGLALQRAGITAEDLHNIQRIAEDRMTEELRHLAMEEASGSEEKINNSAESSEQIKELNSVIQNNMAEQRHMREQDPEQQQQQQPQPQQPSQPSATITLQNLPQHRPHILLRQLPAQPRDTMVPPNESQSSQSMYGRAAFGRSLVQPVRIPVPMMQAQADLASVDDSAAVATESEQPHFVQPRSI